MEDIRTHTTLRITETSNTTAAVVTTSLELQRVHGICSREHNSQERTVHTMSTARRDTHPSPLTQLTLVRCTTNNSSRSHILQGSSHGGPLQALGARQAQLASGVPVCLLLRLGASNQLLPPRPHHNSSLLAPLQLIGANNPKHPTFPSIP